MFGKNHECSNIALFANSHEVEVVYRQYDQMSVGNEESNRIDAKKEMRCMQEQNNSIICKKWYRKYISKRLKTYLNNTSKTDLIQILQNNTSIIFQIQGWFFLMQGRIFWDWERVFLIQIKGLILVGFLSF